MTLLGHGLKMDHPVDISICNFFMFGPETMPLSFILHWLNCSTFKWWCQLNNIYNTSCQWLCLLTTHSDQTPCKVFMCAHAKALLWAYNGILPLMYMSILTILWTVLITLILSTSRDMSWIPLLMLQGVMSRPLPQVLEETALLPGTFGRRFSCNKRNTL